jgi:hypothetical protein
MKTFLLWFLLAASAYGQGQILSEATAAQMTAGTAGAGIYISPRRFSGAGGGVTEATLAQMQAGTAHLPAVVTPFSLSSIAITYGTSLQLTGSPGVLNTIQDIRNSASPLWAGETLSGTGNAIIFTGAAPALSSSNNGNKFTLDDGSGNILLFTGANQVGFKLIDGTSTLQIGVNTINVVAGDGVDGSTMTIDGDLGNSGAGLTVGQHTADGNSIFCVNSLQTSPRADAISVWNNGGELAIGTANPSPILAAIKTLNFGRVTAQTAANATIKQITVGAADSSYIVSANVNVTAAATASFTCTCTYHDETNTTRVLTLTFSNLTGTLLTTITNVTGTGAYEGVPLHIRAKAATTITIGTTGTFTSVTYNAEGAMQQIQ